MSADPNKKSPRTFQCRDALWETFEQLARELECSVDYLVNEAMKQYARQRASARTPLPGTNRVADGSEAGPAPLPPLRPVPGHAAAVAQPARAVVPPVARVSLPPKGVAPPPLPPPPPQAYAPATSPPAARQQAPAPASNVGSRPPPPPTRTVPPPVPPTFRAPPPTAPPAPPVPVAAPQPAYAQTGSGVLSIMYQGEKVPVNKERFIIGRGKQSSDLTLKDPNVSRQHAMVEYHSGVYFMVDMGSTNGVEFNGQRIARKQIGEGDSFRICDHEVVFTFL